MPAWPGSIESSSGSQTASFSLCPRVKEGTRELSGVFERALIPPAREGSTLVTSSPPEAPPPHSASWALGFLYRIQGWKEHRYSTYGREGWGRGTELSVKVTLPGSPVTEVQLCH